MSNKRKTRKTFSARREYSLLQFYSGSHPPGADGKCSCCGKPASSGPSELIGAAIVPDARDPARTAWRLGCNPGGSAAFGELIPEVVEIAVKAGTVQVGKLIHAGEVPALMSALGAAREQWQGRTAGKLTDFAPDCPAPMHRLVMLAGQEQVKELTDHGWPLDIAVFDALLDLPESLHPNAVRLMHEMQPNDRTAEQAKYGLDNATQVLYASFFGLCQEHACPSCKAGDHCSRSDPIACWCVTCDPELDDETKALVTDD